MNALARAIVPVSLIAELLASAGCAKLHANAKPGGAFAPLEAPLPPPRVIVPIESEPIAPAVPPIEAPGPRPAREAPRAVAPPKVEKAEAPPVPPASPPVDDPARALRTPANAGAVEQRIHARLAEAARDLGRIDYRSLNVNAQAQYDIARRFKEQAEDALKMKNLVFAERLADKAAALAAQLLKR